MGYQGPGRGGKGDLLISVYKTSILQFAYVLTTCCAALSLRTAVLAPTLKNRCGVDLTLSVLAKIKDNFKEFSSQDFYFYKHKKLRLANIHSMGCSNC